MERNDKNTGTQTLDISGCSLEEDYAAHATTTLEVDVKALLHNIALHRAHLKPDTKIIGVIKAFGYGHGSQRMARVYERAGASYLAVAFTDEGIYLRRGGITLPVIILSGDRGSYRQMIRWRLEPEIGSLDSLDRFAEEVKREGAGPYPIHLKLDTGMHRVGFEEHEVEELIKALDKYSGEVRVVSIFSHMASSDTPAHDEFSQLQIERFRRMQSRITACLPYKPMLHIANSAAIQRFPEADMDMVRLGIGAYAKGDLEGFRYPDTLKTRIMQIKNVEPGETVGYGRAGVIDRPTRIATIPVGYADGLRRGLSGGKWSMMVGGRRAPIVGRVCMDTCMIDVTGIDAREGDEVIIFGPYEGLTVDDMAEKLGTIPYEVLTSIAYRVRRVFKE